MKNHEATPFNSATAPAITSPRGIVADIKLFITENARPCASFGMVSCIYATYEMLYRLPLAPDDVLLAIRQSNENCTA